MIKNQISKLLSFTRIVRNDAQISDVKIDPGGGPNITAEDFRPAGDDAHPLTSDYALASATQRSGGQAITGYVDPINEPKAQPGDTRIYGRESENGTEVNQVWLKNDGSVLVSNENGSVLLRPDGGSIITTPESTFDAAADGSIAGANGNGSFELQAGGDFVVNGVTIAANGDVTVPSSLTLNGKELDAHDHPIAWTDPAGSGTSGPNN